MKTKELFLIAVVLLLLTSLPVFLYADDSIFPETVEPLFPPTVASGKEYEIPPVQGAKPYPYPIVEYQLPDAIDLTGLNAPTDITIDVWYDLEQSFGDPGTPQEWINILGNVSGPQPIVSLNYTLNGGEDKPLSIGGTEMARLYSPGDFNVEIHYSELNDGPNTLVIKAFDGSDFAEETVTVNYSANNTIPLPYSIDWGSITNIHDVGQPVDGQWTIDNGELKTVVPGYDRVFAIGDMEWTDYEVTVPINVASINTAEWGAPSFGAGIGLLVRWQGHIPGGDDAQPLSNWRRLGALAWYRWNLDNSAAFEILGHGGGQTAINPDTGAIQLGTTYNFKVSVQSPTTLGDPATYRFKYWPQGSPEPIAWYLKAKGNPGEPESGSVLLTAHQVMASFGDVIVEPIQGETFTINVNQPANGQIFVTPEKATYSYGETVTIRTQGDPGFGLTNWTGSFSGTENPLVFDITENITVGAILSPADQPTLTVSVDGEGEVDIDPDKTGSSYLYGEEVVLTPQPAAGHKFAGWSGDLTGLDDPATIVMDKTKNIVAKFVIANTGSPVSDDFHACQLNTNLWTFVNPLGDGSFEVDGSRLLLSVPAGISHNIWTDGNNAVRVVQPTQNNSFEVVTKLDSQVTQQYQMQGILVEQDEDDFLRFETFYDGTEVHVYAASFVNGNPQPKIDVTIAQSPPYLRVTRAADQWSLSYSSNGSTWVSAGNFSRTMTVTKSGIYAGNFGSPPDVPIPAHTAIVDYFFNTASPIDPEDGGGVSGFNIETNVIGEGTVTLNPDNAPYSCGETVTLTAVPAQGWKFSNWSGDLSGFNPSQQLVVSGNHEVTATFVEESVVIEYKVFLPMGVDN